MAVNVLFFLGEIVRVSFHIDQEFRLASKIAGRIYTPLAQWLPEFLWGRNRNLFPASKHTVAASPDSVAYFRFTHVAGVSLPVPVEMSGCRGGT